MRGGVSLRFVSPLRLFRCGQVFPTSGMRPARSLFEVLAGWWLIATSSHPVQVLNCKKTGGAALIEFALVLPLLLAIAVGIVYYGYAFVLKTALEHAARNGVQEAVAVSPLVDGYGQSLLFGRARDVAIYSLDWLPAAVRTEIVVDEDSDCGEGEVFGLAVRLPLSNGETSVLPQLSLGGFQIPPLPTVIVGRACVAI